ncbi:MAG: YbaB/EbfC family nucleoid-associated protein [Candidatus Adiutrix sp.]|jgi:DNA-binding YbaB/EbfC family protein|nr:YbaB/EbfC family nucleoid-associated protein [Candidatus Adiutrix sp.]
MTFDLGSMGGLIKQAQEMQKKITDMQAEMAKRTVTAAAGGGMVTVTVNGASEIVSVRLEREIINPADPEMLADLIVAAVNDALRKVQDMVAAEMGRVTGGLNIPGLFK